MDLNQRLKQIPSIDSLLQKERVQFLCRRYSRKFVLEQARSLVKEWRESMRDGGTPEMSSEMLDEFPSLLEHRIDSLLSPALRPVINASGVILHTNVGRAPIAPFVAESMSHLACSYSNLEFDLQAGGRGHRDSNFEERITRLLGCEAATVANNNAAALLLILNTLADGRNVLVSRGELIEIGGSFRLPAIMQRSGAILKEVGTTNKTRTSDYRDAIDAETALILRVHPSNYLIAGFTETPSLDSLVSLSREAGIPLVEDVGSGYLFRTDHAALREEPTVKESVGSGVDLACFSGDKLLGGPQSGLIVGRRDLVSRIRKNHLMRAVRVDKVTYAALERTIIEYETGRFQTSIPIYRMLSLTRDEVRQRAEGLVENLRSRGLEASIAEGESLIGGGSAPGKRLATCLVRIRAVGQRVDQLEERLRRNAPPILGRIEKDHLLLDLRTVDPNDDDVIATALSSIQSPFE